MKSGARAKLQGVCRKEERQLCGREGERKGNQAILPPVKSKSQRNWEREKMGKKRERRLKVKEQLGKKKERGDS